MPERFPEVALAPGTLFVADLHLDVEDGAAVERFLGFLERAGGAPRVVVLGDLFEYWLGPPHQRTDGGQRLVDALAARARRGVLFDVVPGNRDFLLDAGFERAAGARVHRHGFVGVLPDGGRVLFVHGDELATLDVAYQRLRRVLRSRPLLWLAPRLPLTVSRGLARRLRRASTGAVARKPPEEKSLQPAAAAALLRATGAAALVCGHAHEFRDERPEDAGRWMVLDAFGGTRDLLRVGAAGELAVEATRALG
ncbi:MAG: metallophosphoesterase [Planctomycetota bacterium]